MQIGRNGGPLQKAVPRDDAEPALQRTPLIRLLQFHSCFPRAIGDTDDLVRLEAPFVRGEKREKRKLPPSTAIYDINERI